MWSDLEKVFLRTRRLSQAPQLETAALGSELNIVAAAAAAAADGQGRNPLASPVPGEPVGDPAAVCWLHS